MKKLLIILSFSVMSIESEAQGCSDAGFCSMGAMKSNASGITANRNSLGLTVTYGKGEKLTTTITPQLEFALSTGRKGFIEGKLPVNIASGNLDGHAGIGDPVINYTHSLLQGEHSELRATGGLRISTGKANAEDMHGNALPMPYQNNLGTTDIILGMSARVGKYLSCAAGWQQPVIHYNENGYLPSMIEAPGANDYFASRKLKRQGDVLLRVEGRYSRKNFGIAAGPLLIYHLGKDRVTLLTGAQVLLEGSEGLTLNLSGNVFYKISKWRFDISAGAPVLVRKYRPDGLTREFVVAPGITYFFNPG